MSTSSVSLCGTLVGGAAGSAALLGANQAAHVLGVTRLDLGEVLGWSFVQGDPRRRKAAGFAWYAVSGGVLVPLLYWVGFRLLGGASEARGLGFGLVHYLVSGVLLAATNPHTPSKAAGEGRPMGGFLTNYGALERVTNLLGHLAYGMLVGTAARRW